MPTYEPPTDQTLFGLWFESLTKEDSTTDYYQAKEAFNATMNDLRAEALKIAAAAVAGGIPSHMTAAQWLEVQAMVYVEAPYELTHVASQAPRSKAHGSAERISVRRPKLPHTPEPLSQDEAASQTLLGAACAVESSSMFGSNLRATVGTVLRNASEATWANHFTYAAALPEIIVMPRPHVPFGPQGVSTEASDADYLRTAAEKLERFYKRFSVDTRLMVVTLLRDVAEAVEAIEPKTFARAY